METLQGFEAYNSEALAVAAAGWYFEREDFAKVVSLTKNFRFLSRYADDAFLLHGLSLLELKQTEAAVEVLKKMSSKAHLDNLHLAIAEVDPARIDKNVLISLASQCTDQQAELFYRALMCLLKKNCLAEARALCQEKTIFLNHATLGPIMAKILPASQSSPG